jgi:hypothetical protein
VAGGAAFLVAAGMLIPGRRSRRTALVENGRRAIRLIGVSTMLLLVAGALEGFISPIEWWPLEGKLAVSGTTLVLLVVYLRGGRTAPARRDDAGDPDLTGDATTRLAMAPLTARRAP